MFLILIVYTFVNCTSKEKAWNSHHSDTEALVCPISETDRAHAILPYSMNISSVASLIKKLPVFCIETFSERYVIYLNGINPLRF